MTQVQSEVKKTKKSAPPQVAEENQTEMALAPRGSNLPSTEVEQHQEVLNSDIIIPKVLLMQGLSDFVQDRKAAIGDMVRSTTAEKLGDDKAPISFIPLKMSNAWTISEKVDEKYEFRRVELRNAANEDLPYEFSEGGTDWKRVKTINVFALLTKDILAFHEEIKKDVIDLEKTLMPIVLSFRSTSYSAGKTVATFFTKVRSNLQYQPTIAPYKYELTLSCKQDENDKGKYFVYEVGASKPIPAPLIEEAAKWFNILNTAKNIKIDVSDEGGSTAAAAPLDVTSTSKF